MKELILSKLCQDGQDYKILEKIYDRILKFLSAGEKIEYIAIQKRPALNLFPDSIVLTKQRIYLCEFVNFGRNLKPTVLDWDQIIDISYKEYSGLCTLTIIPNLDIDFIIEHIPLDQGFKVMIKSDEFRNENDSLTSITPISNESSPTPLFENEKKQNEINVREEELKMEIRNPAYPEQVSRMESSHSIEKEDADIGITEVKNPEIQESIAEESAVQESEIEDNGSEGIENENPENELPEIEELESLDRESQELESDEQDKENNSMEWNWDLEPEEVTDEPKNILDENVNSEFSKQEKMRKHFLNQRITFSEFHAFQNKKA